ncbi:putative E3 ubiquitin-protein ligase RNF14 [Hypsibius exemplaris]|uniref:RBR-type E3 ubiquitin transferase n=1 Tax=Hypsibius exemplaris TaxID=2072580 RepID=A0A1W0XES8_HYPEX|nr:putative E3 ubiquitin-protein ligase RNF14 [Hypsibius exemplaris]
MATGLNLNPKFILLKDTISIPPSGLSSDEEGILMPAGCLVQEIKGGSDTSSDEQILLLESLDAFHHSTAGAPLYAHAAYDDLLEVSSFTSSLLRAEKQFKLRLVVARDENWLEEATKMFDDTEVLVTVGPAQLLGVIRFVDEITVQSRMGRWFGVELKESPYMDIGIFIESYAPFKCSPPARGIYVTIGAIRLADPVADVPFKGRPFGKKRFSTRPALPSTHKLKIDSAGGREQTADCESAAVKRYEVDDRVVWFGAENGAARGTVRHVGRTDLKQTEDVVVVEFDDKVGDQHYKGRANGLARFAIREGFGKEILPAELMSEVDFGYEIGGQPSSGNTGNAKASSSTTTRQNGSGDGKVAQEGVIGIGSRVMWRKSDEEAVAGKVMWSGQVKRQQGKKFALRLDERKGTPDFCGIIDGVDQFHCGPGYGMIVPPESLVLEERYNEAFGIHPRRPVESDIRPVQKNDKIVWFEVREGKSTPQHGVVLYVGEVPGMAGMQLGVEFTNACGQKDWSGKFKGKQLFTCKLNHGRWIARDKPDTWLRKEDYDRRQKKLETSAEPSTDIQSKDISPPDELKSSSESCSVAGGMPDDDGPPFTSVANRDNIGVGDRVLVKQVGSDVYTPGTVRWIGVIKAFLNSHLVGLEMDEPVGSETDVTACGYAGSHVKGYIEVFQCKPGYGRFEPPSKVKPLEDKSWTKVGSPKFKHAPARIASPIFIERNADLNGTTASFHTPMANGFHNLLQAPPQRPIKFKPNGMQQQTPISSSHPQSRQPMPHAQPTRQHSEAQFPQNGQEVVAAFGQTHVQGTVQYVGRVHFSPGIFVGVALSQYMMAAPGGMVDGYDYFQAMIGYGILVPLQSVAVLPPTRLQYDQSIPHSPDLQGFPSLAEAEGVRRYSVGQRNSNPGPIGPPATPDDVLKALAQADEEEREFNFRKSYVAIFRLQAEDQGSFEVTVDEKDGTKGFVKFLPKPPAESEDSFFITRITMPEPNNGHGGGGGDFNAFVCKKVVKDVEFFPPLFLNFHLTNGFPNHLPPVYDVTCNWITEVQVKKLREYLVRIWREYMDQTQHNILYESLRNLKQHLLRIMGLEFGIIYISRPAFDLDPSATESHYGTCLYGTDREVQDVFSRLAKFSDTKVRERDENDQVECSICASTVSPGQVTFFSMECSHSQMFCKDCIASHVKAQVEGGNITEIPCMGDACKVTATFNDLADLINPLDVDALSQTLNSRLLDGMPDTRRCPQCQCVIIFDHAMLGGNDRYITCPNPVCGIQYCPHCKAKSHGDEPCLSSEKKRELRDLFINAATQAEKEALIRVHGKENIEHSIRDMESEDYIKTHGKPCPQCKSPTEKIEGCNKMTCTICHTFFCYICGVQLPKTDPYSHFNNDTCAKFDHR